MKISILLILLLFSSTQFAQANFTVDVPYQQAVPSFLDEINLVTGQNLSEDEIMDIEIWEQGIRSKINDFLLELTTVVADYEVHGSNEKLFADLEAFRLKWYTIVNSIPHFDKLQPFIAPIMDKAFEGIVKVEKSKKGEPPLAGLQRWYNEMEQLNPWGTASFYQIEPMPKRDRDSWLKELIYEQVRGGTKKAYVLRREQEINENGERLFYELVENDNLIERYFKPIDPTLAHELLRIAQDTNAEPYVVNLLEGYVKYIDEQLLFMRDKGVLSEEVYNIIYGLAPQYSFTTQNQISNSNFSDSLRSVPSGLDNSNDEYSSKYNIAESSKIENEKFLRSAEYEQKIKHDIKKVDESLKTAIEDQVTFEQYNNSVDKILGVWVYVVMIPLYLGVFVFALKPGIMFLFKG